MIFSSGYTKEKGEKRNCGENQPNFAYNDRPLRINKNNSGEKPETIFNKEDENENKLGDQKGQKKVHNNIEERLEFPGRKEQNKSCE